MLKCANYIANPKMYGLIVHAQQFNSTNRIEIVRVIVAITILPVAEPPFIELT